MGNGIYNTIRIESDNRCTSIWIDDVELKGVMALKLTKEDVKAAELTLVLRTKELKYTFAGHIKKVECSDVKNTKTLNSILSQWAKSYNGR